MNSASPTSLDIPLPAPVLIVEDEPLLQARLQGILLEVGYPPAALLFAATVSEAQAMLRNEPLALALVDLMLPDGSGLNLIEQMRNSDPSLGILVISAWSTAESILNALRAGATGYVLKERDDIEVTMAIRSVLRGGAPIDPFIARRILELLPDSDKSAGETSTSGLAILAEPTSAGAQQAIPAGSEALSERETQILRLVADGLTNREIAEQLFISRHTVESHIKRVYRKLSVSSRTMAIRTARERGVLE
ncbi:LuxR C-terminal-related transcriptional regulator [Orrella marina]|uniref:DNA-binding response regulator n=1 Tax=Orrella marina TaxID=2163011 RepID=A0A2R4XLB2_9BURK|nr:response regulator transcription factor [Orrella marina]AWB34582.1 DNA-binding response regulator [Orrella marina]